MEKCTRENDAARLSRVGLELKLSPITLHVNSHPSISSVDILDTGWELRLYYCNGNYHYHCHYSTGRTWSWSSGGVDIGIKWNNANIG